MFRKLLFLFILVPAIEVGLFIAAGKYIGFPVTILIIFLTGIIGAYLAKREGLETIKKVQSQIQNGQMPADAVLDGACILIGGALLLAPGFLTDIMGFSLLFPPFRKVPKLWIKAFLFNKVKNGQFYFIRRR
ncbi:FxsA family protein [Fictibacillus barbaricus]|uniref:UPF0716 protein FxsA n=1 Tax=Fictibacillus barbaricus TaxID=182136 RepID=A0ABU1U2Q7_9BACL|nr:FxsA family protein [Fictibacillus barbaricus]MDR7073763.1 UPF0716 protein FxsA [Fictibacillus barbaricus]